MSKLKRLLAVSVSLMMLCGCGKKITEGEVYEKNFTEAHSQVLMLPLVHSNGKSMYTTMIPYIRYYPDTYSIGIRDFQDDKWVTETYYVSEEVYNEVEIGDMFK